jgi:putative sterol carrier protein
VGDGKCVLTKGAPEPARVTLTLALPNFLKLIAGKLNGQMAFMTGKLKMKGDLSIAMAMQSWFDQA